MAEKKSREETVEYVAKLIKDKADMAYAEVRKVAKAAGHHVYPLIMGLAKGKLGLGKPKSAKSGRGPGRPKGSSRGPGRPAGTGRGSGRPAMGMNGDLIRGIARLHDDATAMRSALREIAKAAARF